MTYQLNNGITMELIEAGADIFHVDPELRFYRDGKEVPTLVGRPSMKAFDIEENLTLGCYTLTMTFVDGVVTHDNFPSLGSIVYHAWWLCAADDEAPPKDILPLAYEYSRYSSKYPYCEYAMEVAQNKALAAMAAKNAAEPAPTAHVTDNTTPATDAAQDALQAAMALLKEDENVLFDDDSPLRITFHAAQRIFADGSTVSLADIENADTLLINSDELFYDAQGMKKGKAQNAAYAAASDAHTSAVNACSGLFTDDDLQMLQRYSKRLTRYNCSEHFNAYNIMLHLKHAMSVCNLDTLVLSTNRCKAILKCENGTDFGTEKINSAYIASLMSMGYHIRLADQDDTLAVDILADSLYDLICRPSGLSLEWINGDDEEADIQTEKDLITIAEHASPADMLTLFLVVNFGHWRNDPHGDMSFIKTMAERLRGATTAPSEDPQNATETAPSIQAANDTTQTVNAATEPSETAQNGICEESMRRSMKRVLSAAKGVIQRCDRYAKLRREGVYDLAEYERGDIMTMGASMQLEPVGYIDLELWDDINSRADAAAGGRHTPKYYGYVAAEYVKLANEYLATVSD